MIFVSVKLYVAVIEVLIPVATAMFEDEIWISFKSAELFVFCCCPEGTNTTAFGLKPLLFGAVDVELETCSFCTFLMLPLIVGWKVTMLVHIR